MTDIKKAGIESGMAKAANYVPESHKMQMMIENHRRRGHEAELERLKAKHEAAQREAGRESGRFGGGLLGGMAGVGLGTIAGMALGGQSNVIGHEAGAALGMIGGGLAGGTAGYMIGGRRGARAGAARGRAYGEAEAGKRQQGVMATEGMSKKQKGRYFGDLIAQKRHRQSMAAKKRMARAMEEQAEAERQRARLDTSREAREWSDRHSRYYGQGNRQRSPW